MRARAWEHIRRWPRRPSGDVAVSPVIGMILVLGISIVGTASILYWGLPAIDEMKVNVEYRSVQGQFQELDATLKELVAGTTEKTAKRWQPSLTRGEVAIREGTQGWLYATDLYSTGNYDIGWEGFSDGDHAFTLRNLDAAPLGTVKVECFTVQGTTSLTALNVSIVSGSAVQMTGADLVTWAGGGAAQTFYLYKKDVTPATAVPITGETFKCRVFSGSALVAEGWYANTGSIDYTLESGMGRRRIVENNGALLAGDGVSYAITNTPPIPPPGTTGNVPRFFGRGIVLEGDASFAGQDRFDLLVSLYSTAVLASYDCALPAKTDCVESAKLYVFGDLQEPWHRHLTNTGKGYQFVEKTHPGSGVKYLEDRRPEMGYTLLQSTVLMTG